MTHEIDLERIAMIETDVTMATERMTKEIKANQKKNTLMIKANNIKALAEIKSET